MSVPLLHLMVLSAIMELNLYHPCVQARPQVKVSAAIHTTFQPGQQVVEEVPQNMFRIPSAEENIIMEMPQKIRI